MSDDGFTPIDDGFVPVSDTGTPSSPPSLGNRVLSGLGTGMQTGLETLGAPFQVLGEAIRGAAEGEPLKIATAENQSGFRVPSILQRGSEAIKGVFPSFPSLRTDEQPADPFQQAISGLKGITATTTNLGQGIQPALSAGEQAVKSKPSMIDALMAMGLAAGTGEAGNAPFTAASKAVSAPAKLLGEVLHTGEMAGLPVGMAAKSATGMEAAPIGLANLTKEAIPEIAKASEQTGVPITAAGLTGSPTQSLIEGFLSRFPFSSDVMQKFHANQLSKLGTLRDAVLPAVRSDQEIGNDVQNAFSQLSQEAYKTTQQSYTKVGDLVGSNTIPTSNLQSKAQELMTQQSKLPPAARASGVGPILDQLTNELPEIKSGSKTGDPHALYAYQDNFGPNGAPRDIYNIFGDPNHPTMQQRGWGSSVPKEMLDQSGIPIIGKQVGAKGSPTPSFDYPTLQGLRAELNARIASADASVGLATPGMKFMSTPEAGIYKQLKTALRSDIDVYAQTNPDFANALQTADSQYGTFKDLFKNNKYVQGIIRNQNPQAVVNQAIQLDNPNAMKTLEASLPPNLMNELKINYLRKMGESAPGEFSPTKFASQYRKLGDDKLSNFLGDPLMDAVRPLYLLSHASQTAEKLGGNLSETGRMIMGTMGLTAPIVQGIRLMAQGHPVKGPLTTLSILGGEMEAMPLLAKGYLSPMATRFLSRQTGMMPSLSLPVAPAAKYANPLLGAIQNARGPSDFNQNQNQTSDGFIPVQ